MTPEEKARQTIDRMLQECGWVIQGRDDMDIYAGPGDRDEIHLIAGNRATGGKPLT